MSDPATTWSLPAMSAANPALATSAGSVFGPAPVFVSSIPARSKKGVSVAPGWSAVMVTFVSLSSSRIASANDCTNALDAE